jgi:tetratricopeptide (TPR) repeat protein
MDLALTLHQIAQLFRKQGEFSEALEAFEVALRGMKYSLGRYHPNVAAVLGNVGNLQKEMGDLDAAYKTYQEVLGIESYRLGLSHPDVAITVSYFLHHPRVGFLFLFSWFHSCFSSTT